jgi:Arc/MetJ-type ribon-helix-helix transcriptional regulator
MAESVERTVALPRELADAVDGAIQAGEYASTSEAISEALQVARAASDGRLSGLRSAPAGAGRNRQWTGEGRSDDDGSPPAAVRIQAEPHDLAVRYRLAPRAEADLEILPTT